jgi:hypothetical protein
VGLYWRFFNFAARRVVAPAFILGGCVVALSQVGALLPGGTVLVDGSPSSDLVFRLAAVLLPLLVAALGVALYRAKPFVPPGSHDA